MSDDRAPTAIGAYVYAGGFTVGVERAGFDVLAHLEGDNAYGVSSARLNWPNLAIHHGPDRWPLQMLREAGVDLAYCNPPCAVFSMMGITTTRGEAGVLSDPRLEHWRDSFRVLEEARPRAWCLESVTEAYGRGRFMVDEFTKRGLMLGYSISHILLDARWHGLPQKRKRFFIVAHRAPTIEPGLRTALNWAPPLTIGEALTGVTDPGERPNPNPGLLALAKMTPPGRKLRWTWQQQHPGDDHELNAQGQVKGRPSFQDCRLDANEIMGAYVGDKFWHPREDRMIGINEAKAICGYPPDFQLAGPATGWPSLLARAVMPPVGAWLARGIREALELPDGSWDDRRVTLLDYREPDRAPVDLTAEYLTEGRVRVRARADGTIAWSSPARPARPPVTPIAPVVMPTVIAGVPEPVPSYIPAKVPQGGGSAAIGDPPPDLVKLDGEGSGKFIRRLWQTTELTPEAILELVHRSYAGRTTRIGDVRYNYYALVKELGAANVRPWPGKTRNPPPAARVSELRKPPEEPSSPQPSPRAPGASGREDSLGVAAPAIVARIGPRIAFTGFTRGQAYPFERPNEDQQNSVPIAVAGALIELGFSVDWARSILGEENREFDAAVVFLGPLLSIPGCQFALQALYTLAEAQRRGKPAAIFYDDWQVHFVHRHLRYAIEAYDGPFRKRMIEWAHIEPGLVDWVKEPASRAAGLLLDGWPPGWVGAYPAHRWGDPSIMERISAAHTLHRVDPTPALVDLTYRYEGPKERRWLLATLGDFSSWVDRELRPGWPVERVGNKKYGKRLATRRDVMDASSANWGVLAPPYRNGLDGSGWMRSRYAYAALGESVLYCDPSDAIMLGPEWQLTPNDIESVSDDRLVEIAAVQRQALFERDLVATRREDWLADVAKVAEHLK